MLKEDYVRTRKSVIAVSHWFCLRCRDKHLIINEGGIWEIWVLNEQPTIHIWNIIQKFAISQITNLKNDENTSCRSLHWVHMLCLKCLPLDYRRWCSHYFFFIDPPEFSQRKARDAVNDRIRTAIDIVSCCVWNATISNIA